MDNVSNEKLLDELLQLTAQHGQVHTKLRELRAEVLQRMAGGEGWAYFDDALPEAASK